jgi:actin beta/gamma 1/actin
VEPKDCIMVLSESPLNPKENREKTAEIMFEKFDVPGKIC